MSLENARAEILKAQIKHVEAVATALCELQESIGANPTGPLWRTDMNTPGPDEIDNKMLTRWSTGLQAIETDLKTTLASICA